MGTQNSYLASPSFIPCLESIRNTSWGAVVPIRTPYSKQESAFNHLVSVSFAHLLLIIIFPPLLCSLQASALSSVPSLVPRSHRVLFSHYHQKRSHEHSLPKSDSFPLLPISLHLRIWGLACYHSRDVQVKIVPVRSPAGYCRPDP